MNILNKLKILILEVIFRKDSSCENSDQAKYIDIHSGEAEYVFKGEI
mgnify:CR=1 FL=1